MTDWSSPEKAIEKIKSLVRAIPDFPIPGINFRYYICFSFLMISYIQLDAMITLSLFSQK